VPALRSRSRRIDGAVLASGVSRLTRVGVTLLTAWLAGSLLPGCRPKVTTAQCDELVEHYAGLVVTEMLPDAGPDRIRAEQEREKKAARSDDAFKNCSSEVSVVEYACAMHAATADAFEKCLE
jgi:hypothetical protein